MLLRISFVVIVTCFWCVIGETMSVSKVISNGLNKNETKSASKLELNMDDKARTPRQLDPNAWQPIPAVWRPRPRSPLNTWWGLPFPFDGESALVRVRPPGAYIPPDFRHHYYNHHHEPHYKDYHKHEHHDDHHHKKEEHHHSHFHHHEPKPLIPPAGPPPYGLYIAQNGGALHIAPLPGYLGNVIASNGFPIGPSSIAIDGPADIPPGPIAPGAVPPPAMVPLVRTW